MPRPRKTSTVSIDSQKVEDATPEKIEPKPQRPRAVSPSKNILSVVTQSGRIDLKFKSEREVEHAFTQITFKCASGRAATVISEGKEYTFCNVDYVIRDEPVQQ